jgi:hypothetical protein
METLVNYRKNNNKILFSDFEKNRIFNTQNFIPIYKHFFSITDKNYNSINLNQKYMIHKILSYEENIHVKSKCIVIDNLNKESNVNIFLKKAPLIDPYYYIMGKYKKQPEDFFKLPNLKNYNSLFKIHSENNSSYVDGFFTFLTSKLKEDYNVVNCIQFYGSFLAYNNFKFDVFEDIDYLIKSEHFVKNQNVLFKIDDYTHLCCNIDINNNKKPSINVLSETNNISSDEIINLDLSTDIQPINKDKDLDSIIELNIDSFDLYTKENVSLLGINNCSRTTTTCSSRSSHTTLTECESDDENCDSQEDTDSMSMSSTNDDSTTGTLEEPIFVTIDNFPINVICSEKCEETLDYLINENMIKENEWFAILMQVIFTLIIFQKCFLFTHNDLHTENIMFVYTKEKYIYYKFNKKTYKVPTYGKIFKIIDFGRSIFKVNGKLICSDEFKRDGNAYGQYNTEPFFNDSKSRLDPNYSFDLCRLACCIFDYIVDDLDDLEKLKSKDPFVRLIDSWCRDDDGLLINYKKNGKERYSGFKYYKMISLKVHKHLPILQLIRPEFRKFECSKVPSKNVNIIDIDNLPSMN